jgi:NTP-dependent ternary system trypsin peptidase co-occuring protein
MGEVLVEVVPKAAPSGDLRPPKPAVPEDFDQRADELMTATLDIADRLRARLDAEPPALAPTTSGWGLREVDLQFGLTLQAEAGVIVAKVGGSAAFQVTLIYRKGDG